MALACAPGTLHLIAFFVAALCSGQALAGAPPSVPSEVDSFSPSPSPDGGDSAYPYQSPDPPYPYDSWGEVPFTPVEYISKRDVRELFAEVLPTLINATETTAALFSDPPGNVTFLLPPDLMFEAALLPTEGGSQSRLARVLSTIQSGVQLDGADADWAEELLLSHMLQGNYPQATDLLAASPIPTLGGNALVFDQTPDVDLWVWEDGCLPCQQDPYARAANLQVEPTLVGPDATLYVLYPLKPLYAL